MRDESFERELRWQELFLTEARARARGLPDEETALARKVAPRIVNLSRGLTRDRALPGGRYLDDPDYALAYLLYYLPTNVHKTRILVETMMARGWLAPRSRLRVLDLGCGPGTLLWGLVAALSAQTTAETALDYLGIDHSPRALEMLESLCRRVQQEPALLGSIRLNPRGGRADLVAGVTRLEAGQDLILVGNALNELFADRSDALAHKQAWIDALVDRLNTGGLLLILEPALQATSETLTRLRDTLRQRPDLELLSPCTHHGPCPLLAPGRPARQWCHQELPWKRSRLIQAIDAHTGLSKERLALSHLLIRRTAGPIVKVVGSYRALSPALRGRGTVTVHLCGAEGFQEALLLTRHEEEGNAEFREIQRGDEVSLIDATSTDRLLRIGPQTRVHRTPPGSSHSSRMP